MIIYIQPTTQNQRHATKETRPRHCFNGKNTLYDPVLETNEENWKYF